MMAVFSMLSTYPLTILLLEWGLLAIILALLIPVAVLAIECSAAFWFSRSRLSANQSSRPRIAVLVPAHNEAVGILETLQTLIPQLTDQDRLVVVADNCDDETAIIARSLGAQVLERQDPERRGKGYALDYGLQFLAVEPPDVVVMIDADCQVHLEAISRISALATATMRPVQAIYLLESLANPSPKTAVSLLAFTVKNLVRPMGLAQLGFPCLLTGTGMAFPWPIISAAALASGNIVEDMQLALDLTIAGYPPILCPDAKVTGVLPEQQQAAKRQRTRWEHGHLQTLFTQVPRLLKAAVQQTRLDLLVIALDLCIPPLSLLVLLWLCVTLMALIAYWLGTSWMPIGLAAMEGFLIFCSIFTAWFKFARSGLPAQTLLTIPLYILWKLPLYLAFLIQPEKKWIRTERPDSCSGGDKVNGIEPPSSL